MDNGKTDGSLKEAAGKPALGDAFARLQSRLGSLLHIESKARRWGLNSVEPREGHPDAGRSNFSLLLREFIDLKAASAEVEAALIDEMLAGTPECPALEVARKLGRDKGVAVLREVLGTDHMDDIPPSKWPEVEDACRMQMYGLSFFVDPGRLYVNDSVTFADSMTELRREPEPEPTEEELLVLARRASAAVGPGAVTHVVSALSKTQAKNIRGFCVRGYDKRRLAAELQKLVDSDTAKQLRALRDDA